MSIVDLTNITTKNQQGGIDKWELIPTGKFNLAKIKLNDKILEDVLYDYTEKDDTQYHKFTYWHVICHATTGEVHTEVLDNGQGTLETCLTDLAISLAQVDTPNQIFKGVQ